MNSLSAPRTGASHRTARTYRRWAADTEEENDAGVDFTWGDALKGMPWGWLAWFLVVVLWLTWTPVGTIGPRLGVLPSAQPDEMAGNLALLAPIGALVALVAPLRARVHRIALRSGAAGALISSVIEIGQLSVAGRVVSPYDLLLNAAGAALAGLAIVTLRRYGVPAGRLLLGTGSAVVVSVGLLVSVPAVSANSMLRLEGWDSRFHVAAAGEMGGERGTRLYRGQVFAAQICAGDVSERVCVEPGAAAASREALVQAASTSQRLGISARVLSDSDQQTGPARIVTFSRDETSRNVTLAQSDRDLLLRVRTELMGPNGSMVQFRLPGSIRMGDTTAVFATYAPGRVTMHADGAAAPVEGIFPTGFLAAWRMLLKSETARVVEPVNLWLAVAISAVVLFLPLGLGLGWLKNGSFAAVTLVAAGSGAAILLAVESALRNGVFPSHLLAVAAAAALGAALGRLDRARWRSASEPRRTGERVNG